MASLAQERCLRKYAYATLITSDSFIMGVETMLFSLRSTGTKLPIIVLVTEQVSKSVQERLSASTSNVEVKVVPTIANPNTEVHIEGWVNSGYTKLGIWTLLEYNIVFYIDADTTIMENVDSLFKEADGRSREASGCLFAAPDVFPPDRFNAGVMIIRPSMEIFDSMMTAIKGTKSYDGGDTGFLNAFFPSWYRLGAGISMDPSTPSEVPVPNEFCFGRLPFACNAQRTLHWMTFKKQPGYWEAIKPIKILHYSSTPKPWENNAKKGDLEMVWWDFYLRSQLGAVTNPASAKPNNPLGLIGSFLG